MKVTLEKVQLLCNVINDTYRLVKIYWNDADENGDYTTATFEVNWGCVGSTTTTEAREFTQKLMYACAIVDLLNSLQIEIQYDGDTILANKQSFKATYKVLQDKFQNNKLTWFEIIDFLTMI